MTAEKMTLAEALDLAIDAIDGDGSPYKSYPGTDNAESGRILREFRERGLPFYEAAEKMFAFRAECAARGPGDYAGRDWPRILDDAASVDAAYRRWKEGA